MKFILTEGNLKSFIKKKLGIDLTGKIRMYTDGNSIPVKFKRTIDTDDYNRLMNRFGPFFLINAGHGREFLVQNRIDKRNLGDEFIGIDVNEQYVMESEVLEYLKLDILGLKLSKIIDMYFDESEDINESVSAVKRRLYYIDDFYTFATNVIYKGEKICDLYTGHDMLLDVIANYIVEKMYNNYFSDIDDNSNEWEDMVIFIEKYIEHKYGDSVKEYWEKTCGKLTEGEITEKCWRGYTQKGMKTMFGKRYPNCVKKTKK
jgi:hypothetical protein